MSESESHIASRGVHGDSTLMFTLGSDKDHRKNITFVQRKLTFIFDGDPFFTYTYWEGEPPFQGHIVKNNFLSEEQVN